MAKSRKKNDLKRVVFLLYIDNLDGFESTI